MTTAPSPHLALRGDLLDFTADPGFAAPPAPACASAPTTGCWSRTAASSARSPATSARRDWQRHDHRGRLILPGFIDTHVHSPQLDVIARYGTELLEWLDTYTFPAERRHAEDAEAPAGAARFLDALLCHGTTSAVVFPTVHKLSVDALFAAAASRGMRLVAGKVLMDRHAPDGLRDDVDQAERDCVDLIERWHGRGRLAYARDGALRAHQHAGAAPMAGALCTRQPGTYMQTHVAENRDEVAGWPAVSPSAQLPRRLRPPACSTSARARPRHLDRRRDRAALRRNRRADRAQPVVQPVPGQRPVRLARREAGVAVSLATDVGGGTSLSMLRTLADAYKVQAMRGERLTAWKALYSATRGAARALHLDDEIGSLEAGRRGRRCVWDSGRAVAVQRVDLARSCTKDCSPG